MLTRFEKGSFKELFYISLPLMLSSFSVTTMIFVDRLFIAQISTEALAAVTSASTLGWTFGFAFFALASIVEVFVAQYNGGGKPEMIGKPVWQMLWFSIASWVFFIPLSKWGTHIIWDAHQIIHKEYFSWMVLFSPFQGIYGALMGFFIGRGKTLLITFLAVSANFLNAFLDWILIFGIEGVFQGWGVEGAAIATSLSTIIEAIVLFFVFINKKNRVIFQTGSFFLQKDLLWQQIKIGTPSALAGSLDIAGWAFFYIMMEWVGTEYILAASVAQSLIILLYFFPDGLSKGVITITGNLIGASEEESIKKVLLKAVVISFLFFIFLGLISPLWKDFFIQNLTANCPDEKNTLCTILQTTLFLTLGYLCFDAIRMVYGGILTAAGDTLFLMLTTVLSMWFCIVLPTYFFIVKGGGSIIFAVWIQIFYIIFLSFCLAWRYHLGKWERMKLVSNNNLTTPCV